MAAITASADTGVARPTVTIDAFLGGRVEIFQPGAGHHRSGLEAVLLAASLPAETQGCVVDLGAGAGVVGLCVAARCPQVEAVLVERNAVAVECARAALSRPSNRGFSDRVTIVEASIETRSEFPPGRAEAVLFNPPFYDAAASSASPELDRADAHMLDERGLDPWFRAASAFARTGGTATIVFRADGLELILEAAKGRFGGLDILPIMPRPGLPAHRILVRGIKASRAPTRLLPPIILHEASGGGFRPEIDTILRDGAGLADLIPAWNRGGSA